MTPYIISQCGNHTMQERKCLPTFVLAIIVNFNGFEENIADFQWFLRKPSPLNVFRLSDHCHQWFFDGFWFFYHRFQWFSMVPDHWSNDAMVSMDRHGLYGHFDNLKRNFKSDQAYRQHKAWGLHIGISSLFEYEITQNASLRLIWTTFRALATQVLVAYPKSLQFFASV